VPCGALGRRAASWPCKGAENGIRHIARSPFDLGCQLVGSLPSDLRQAELCAVGLAWLVICFILLAGSRPSRLKGQARDRRAVLGLLIQIAGYFTVRVALRPPGLGFLGAASAMKVASAFLALAALLASLFRSNAAVRTLGKQWSLRARLVRAHELIHEGPYAFVRQSTYTAMFGMLIGTALVASSWQAMIAGTVVFLLGTAWRIRAEEHLIVEAFGAPYREYVATVPALIPRLRLSDVPATPRAAGHH
jgi:protein-S-isoprenylcysteine O-methyltransferase Ste14